MRGWVGKQCEGDADDGKWAGWDGYMGGEPSRKGRGMWREGSSFPGGRQFGGYVISSSMEVWALWLSYLRAVVTK